MPRPRDPKRDEAFRLWRESGGTRLLKDIAEELGCSPSLIRKWKNQDHWKEKLNGNVTKQNDQSNGNVTNPVGAPKGNKNAKEIKETKEGRRRLEIKTPKGIVVAQPLKEIKTLCVLVSMNQSYLISWMIQKKSCLARSKQTRSIKLI